MTLAERVVALEKIESPGAPVLSVYLDLAPGVTEMRSVAPRLRDLLYPIRARAADAPHDVAESLGRSVEHVLAMAPELEREVGHGLALFVCPDLGLDERLVLTGHVWDRASVGSKPYLRPLRSVLDSDHPVAAVVVDARRVWILVVELGEMVSDEVVLGEEVRKEDFGGWFALEESRSRRAAEAARHRLYRTATERLAALRRTVGLEAVFVGGVHPSVDEFTAFLSRRERALLAGSFPVDVHTVEDAQLRSLAVELAAGWRGEVRRRLAHEIADRAASGGRAATGLAATLAAANRHAVDELLVEGAAAVPGWRCGACGALALHGPVCMVCGGVGDEVLDVVEELATAVIDDGGVVVQGAAGAEADVGALLRWV